MDPTAFATAMSARPSLATAMDESASGMDVPAASTVVPMTTAGIFSMHPMRTHHSTIQCVMNPIHAIDMAKETMYHFSHFSSPHGGMVSWNAAYQGRESAHIGHSFLSSGICHGDASSSSSPSSSASVSDGASPRSMAEAAAAARAASARSRAASACAAFIACWRYNRMCPGVMVGVSLCARASSSGAFSLLSVSPPSWTMRASFARHWLAAARTTSAI